MLWPLSDSQGICRRNGVLVSVTTNLIVYFTVQRFIVRRRDNPVVRCTGVHPTVGPPNRLLAQGRRVEPGQNPLGMYSVLISYALMELWLKPDEMERLRNAWRVGAGMKLIVEALECNPGHRGRPAS
jgi:hypothetical protein